MKRISLVLPTIELTQKLIKELAYLGVDDAHTHVFAKRLDKIEQTHLHSASVLQTTDIVPAIKRGAGLGIILSVGIFLLFYFSLPASVTLGFSATVAILIFGLLFGIWASAMIGIGIPSKAVEGAELDIKAGQYLIMFDVPAAREQEFLAKIQKDYPEGHLATPVE